MPTDLTGRLGFIGCGALGSALLRGLIDSKLYPPRKLYVFDRHPARTRAFGDVQHCTNAFETVYNTGTVFLAVKPRDIEAAMYGANLEGKVLVSMVAGVTCEQLRKSLTNCNKVIRVMPNLALRIRQSATAYAVPTNLDPVEMERVLGVFRACGRVEAVPEEDMDIATAVNGSGPAYFTFFMDAMARAAEREGMQYSTALRLIQQTAQGTVELINDSPGGAKSLLNEISTPGGTTEAAIKVLQRRNLEDAIEKAIDTATRRGRDLSLSFEDSLRH